MSQGDYIELHQKRHGKRLDHEERTRKREARGVKKRSKTAKQLRGLKAKIFNKERFKEKVQMKKTLAMHSEKNRKHADEAKVGRDGRILIFLCCGKCACFETWL